jgi:hypothetical protein
MTWCPLHTVVQDTLIEELLSHRALLGVIFAVVCNVPSGNLIPFPLPETAISPTTVSLLFGVVVPIPKLPLESILIRLRLPLINVMPAVLTVCMF